MIYLLVLLALGAGVAIYLMKVGKVKDSDGDFITDVVEDKVEDVKKVVKNVKEELKDVVDAAKEVGNQTGDVINAVKGKKRRGRKPSQKRDSRRKPSKNITKK